MIEFEGVRLAIPESYQESAAPSDSGESVLYIDEEKGDYRRWSFQRRRARCGASR